MGPLVVSIAVLLVYVQALAGGFVWDDRFLILGAPLVERGASLDAYLRAPFWTGTGGAHQPGYYRPLVTLSFALDHRLHGDNPAGYHLTNVLVHTLNAVLVLQLLKKHSVRPFVAVLLAMAWALLPRLAEAGAWVSGRTDLLASCFALAALLAFGPSWSRSVLAALLLGLGLLAKESAVAVLPALAWGEWMRRRRAASSRLTAREAWMLGLPSLVVVTAYAGLRLRAIGYQDISVQLGALGRVATVFDALGTYAAMLLDAFRPRAVIGRLGVVSTPGVAAGVAVLLGTALLVWRFRGRIGVTQATGLGLAFGALVPVLHVIPFPVRTLAADRYLYLPAAGLVLAFAPAVDRLLGVRRPAFAAALAVVLGLGVTCSRRVGVWSDDLEFWVQTYLETPRTNNMAATELASVYYRAALFEDAVALYRRSIGYDDPARRTAQYNVGICLSRLGRREEARQFLLTSRPKHRTASDIEFHLASLELREFDAPHARERLERSAGVGHAGARWLLPRFDYVRQARFDLERKGAQARPEERAQFLTLLGEDVPANADWLRAQAQPDASQALSLDALVQLARSGHRAALLAAYQRHTSRFGAVSPELEEIIALRVAELDRMLAARARLGLPVPESERVGL